MASASFGRKGLAADVIGQPARRRARFGQAAAAPVAPSRDPAADRRAAFLAAERARAADADEGQPVTGAGAGVARDPTLFVREKSLATAYLLWLFLGGFSAHRFYLATPLTAIAQVFLWYVSLMFYMSGQPGAGYLLTAGWLWIIGDAFFIPKLRDAANHKARQRAERLAEPLSL